MQSCRTCAASIEESDVDAELQHKAASIKESNVTNLIVINCF